MRPTLFYLQKNIGITFFTRARCGLCFNAKDILFQSLKKFETPINYKEVDIDLPENKEWFDKYCYDVPVIHIDKPTSTSSKPVKFMHYVTEDEILAELNKN